MPRVSGTRKGPLKAIIIVDHGSRLGEANDMLAEVASLVTRSAPRYQVEVAHMELAEPTIDQALDACAAAGATEVTVLPYMLSPGRHATRDIPRLAGEAARRHPSIRCRVAEPLGVHPLLAQVVLERVRSAERKSRSRSARPARNH